MYENKISLRLDLVEWYVMGESKYIVANLVLG